MNWRFLKKLILPSKFRGGLDCLLELDDTVSKTSLHPEDVIHYIGAGDQPIISAKNSPPSDSMSCTSAATHTCPGNVVTNPSMTPEIATEVNEQMKRRSSETKLTNSTTIFIPSDWANGVVGSNARHSLDVTNTEDHKGPLIDVKAMHIDTVEERSSINSTTSNQSPAPAKSRGRSKKTANKKSNKSSRTTSPSLAAAQPIRVNQVKKQASKSSKPNSKTNSRKTSPRPGTPKTPKSGNKKKAAAQLKSSSPHRPNSSINSSSYQTPALSQSSSIRSSPARTPNKNSVSSATGSPKKGKKKKAKNKELLINVLSDQSNAAVVGSPAGNAPKTAKPEKAKKPATPRKNSKSPIRSRSPSPKPTSPKKKSPKKKPKQPKAVLSQEILQTADVIKLTEAPKPKTELSQEILHTADVIKLVDPPADFAGSEISQMAPPAQPTPKSPKKSPKKKKPAKPPGQEIIKNFPTPKRALTPTKKLEEDRPRSSSQTRSQSPLVKKIRRSSFRVPSEEKIHDDDVVVVNLTQGEDNLDRKSVTIKVFLEFLWSEFSPWCLVCAIGFRSQNFVFQPQTYKTI